MSEAQVRQKVVQSSLEALEFRVQSTGCSCLMLSGPDSMIHEKGVIPVPEKNTAGDVSTSQEA